MLQICLKDARLSVSLVLSDTVGENGLDVDGVRLYERNKPCALVSDVLKSLPSSSL